MLVKTSNKKPDVIIPVYSVGRSGSTWFQKLLASHPTILSGGEIMNSVLYEDKENIVTSIINAIEQMKVPDYELHFHRNSKINYCFSYHLDQRLHEIDNYLWEKSSKFIIFTRNPLDIYISVNLVIQSKEERCYEEENQHFRYPYKNERLTINPDHMLHFIRRYFFQMSLLEDWMNSRRINFMQISYEDLVDNTESICNDILDFLGLESHSLVAAISKQRTKTQQEIVTNYKAIASFIKKNAKDLAFLLNQRI